jgi:HAMP domain-containing protein
MDIRTKLVFALVAVSLSGMLALAAFSYGAVRGLLQTIAVRQLEAVAETKKQDLEKVIRGWQDRVQLITSRTDLRQGLAELRGGDDPEVRERIEQTLRDALESVQALRGIAVYLPNLRILSRLGVDPGGGDSLPVGAFWGAEDPIIYENVSLDPDGQLMVTFLAPVRRKGQLLGAVKVLLAAQELVEVTWLYTGLGQTGETLLARRLEDGSALILNPLRHDPHASLSRRVSPDALADPILQAVEGHQDVFREGALDYRGREVWAATRYLDEFGWGLVVKVDAEEEMAPVRELGQTLWRLALSLSAFAILAGTVLGMLFARPIRELADVARRVHEGELDLRASERGNDEVTLLARTFNEVTQKLVDKNRQLERQVREGPNGR